MKICLFDGCGKKVDTRGACSMHYTRHKRAGRLDELPTTLRTGCDVPGCKGRHKAKGLCAKHVKRLDTYGTVDATHKPYGLTRKTNYLEHYVEDPVSGCWNFTGTVTPNGYGNVYGGHRGASPIKAHRYFYEHMVGEIPDGMVIDHLCRNTLCVNPEHLEPVTQSENVLRGARWNPELRAA